METTDLTMRAIVRRQRMVPPVLLGVVLLAFVKWVQSPEAASRLLRVALLMPALWLVITLWHWLALKSLRRRGNADPSAVMRYFGSAMSMMVLSVGVWQIVMLSLWIWVGYGGHRSDLDTARRILGLASSAVFLIVGNMLPKILTPLAMLPREQAALVTVARRFVGTTLFILGIVTAVAYVSAPLVYARHLLQVAMVGGLVMVFGAIVWMNLSASRLEA